MGVLLNPFVLVYIPHVLTESLSIIVALLAAGFFFRVVQQGGRYGHVFLCGVLAGYLMEIRPANLGISQGLLIGMMVVFFYHHRRDAVPKRQGLLSVIVLLVGFALPVALQMSINGAVHGELTPFPIRDLRQVQLSVGITSMKYATAFLGDEWQGVRYLSPWISDLPDYGDAPLSFYIDHPWIGTKSGAAHFFSAVNYDFLWVYLHEPKYAEYNWHQLLSSAIQYLGILGAVAMPLKRRRRRPFSRSDLVVLLGVLVFGFSAGIIVFSRTETRFGYALIAILAFSAGAWLLESGKRSSVVNGASFAGLAVYLYLSAELSAWLVAHTVPELL